jgi:sterol desaturase/sphingolipid hydroxylase (fatty acid hydroxylase superfamily)
VTATITKAAVFIAVVALAIVTGTRISQESGIAPFYAGSFVTSLPIWTQGVLALVVADFIGYWTHRAFHCGRLWPFHAVHHSSTQLDWLSSVRVHPVNDILGAIARVVPLLLLGFDPLVLAGVVPFFALYALVLHANVPWSFGPLRWVIATPAFHRWHHTSADEGRDKNFAGLLPIFDLAFGTFYLPKHAQPRVFGVAERVPRGLLGQLAWPFRAARSRE